MCGIVRAIRPVCKTILPLDDPVLVKLGAGDPRFGVVGGIHWHMATVTKIDYIACRTDLLRSVLSPQCIQAEFGAFKTGCNASGRVKQG